MRDARGGGSLRQRRPEVRVAAQAARERWAAKAELVRSSGRTRPGITLADLLREWQSADHTWRPSTVAGYRSVARFLTQDPVGHALPSGVRVCCARSGPAAPAPCAASGRHRDRDPAAVPLQRLLATRVLLPAELMVRRADSTEVTANALVAKSRGAGNGKQAAGRWLSRPSD